MCGRYGHTTNLCPTSLTSEQTAGNPSSSSSHSEQPPQKPTDSLHSIFEEGRTVVYGEWMAATKTRRWQGRGPSLRGAGVSSSPVAPTVKSIPQKQALSKGKEVANCSSGSRFEVLTDMGDEQMDGQGVDSEVPSQVERSAVGGAKGQAGSKSGQSHAKEKEKVDEVVTAASKASLRKDLQPLNVNPTVQTKASHIQKQKTTAGSPQPLKDNINVVGPQVHDKVGISHKPIAIPSDPGPVHNTICPNDTGGSGKVCSGSELGRPPDINSLDSEAATLETKDQAA